MNYIKSLTNPKLIEILKQKAKEEKALTYEVISLIKEVELRRAFAPLGYDSVYAFVRGELGYDETAANRRISAARLLIDVPDVEEKVESGSLSLSNLVQARVFFRKEEKLKEVKLTSEDKKEVLEQLENQSIRKAKKILLAISPEQVRLEETEKQITEDLTRITIVIDEELRLNLEKIKRLLSHKNPHMTNLDLLKEMAEEMLNKYDPERKQSRKTAKPNSAVTKSAPATTMADSTTVTQAEVTKSVVAPPAAAVKFPKGKSSKAKASEGKTSEAKVYEAKTYEAKPYEANPSRYIPAEVKREVWRRNQGCCTFTDPLSKRKCGSNHQVQFHHQIPFALGGESTVENVTLHCRLHNVFTAVQDYGSATMQPYLNWEFSYQ